MLSFVSLLPFVPLFRRLEMFGVDGADIRMFIELALESANPLNDGFDKLTNPESESLKN